MMRPSWDHFRAFGTPAKKLDTQGKVMGRNDVVTGIIGNCIGGHRGDPEPAEGVCRNGCEQDHACDSCNWGL
eukprot:8840712-Pyramimonas_sp.AAC.1